MDRMLPLNFDLLRSTPVADNVASIVHIPAAQTQSAHLLRWTSECSIDDEDSSTGLPELLKAASLRDRHLGMFATTGIVVPIRGSFIAPSTPDTDTLAIYTLVDYISGTQLAHIEEPDCYPLAQRLGNALRQYLDWVVNTGQSYYLWDIFTDDQYTLLIEDDTLVLHDVDAKLAQTTIHGPFPIDEAYNNVLAMQKGHLNSR